MQHASKDACLAKCTDPQVPYAIEFPRFFKRKFPSLQVVARTPSHRQFQHPSGGDASHQGKVSATLFGCCQPISCCLENSRRKPSRIQITQDEIQKSVEGGGAPAKRWAESGDLARLSGLRLEPYITVPIDLNLVFIGFSGDGHYRSAHLSSFVRIRNVSTFLLRMAMSCAGLFLGRSCMRACFKCV